MTHLQKTVLYAGISAAVLVLSGCVVAPARPYYPVAVVTQPQVQYQAPYQPVYQGQQVTAEVEYVQTAPPAPYAEVAAVSPGVGYIWTPGLWVWGSGRYQWRAGTWARPPVGRTHWNHGVWNHQPGRGWYRSGGHWR